MSWNDQNNNNGSRDPWGNKNDAPDIDEAIKRFKAIFGPIFGGSSGCLLYTSPSPRDGW